MVGEDTAPPERVGQLLDDAYRLERRIALDEHTETYFGLQLADEQAVFVHILRPEFALNASVARTFLNDAQLRGETLAMGSDEIGIPFFVRSYEDPPRAAPASANEARPSRATRPAPANEARTVTSDAPELSFSSVPPALRAAATDDLGTANTMFAQNAPVPPRAVPARPSSSPRVTGFSSAPSPAPTSPPDVPKAATRPNTGPPRSPVSSKPVAAPSSGTPGLSWEQLVENMASDPASTVSTPPARPTEKKDAAHAAERSSTERFARAGRASREARKSGSTRPGATAEVLGRTKPERAAPVLPEKWETVPGGAPLATEQLQALIELNQEDDEKKRRRFLLLLFLPFLVLLAGATPLLHEPELVGARALLGDKLKIASSLFAASSVIVLIGMWAQSSQIDNPVFKVTSIAFTFVSACLCVRGLSIITPIGPVGGLAAGGLPYFTAGFFGMLFLWAMLVGLQSIRGAGLYGAFVMLLALLSLGASHQVLAATVLGKTSGGMFATRTIVKRIAGKDVATMDPLDVDTLAEPGEAEVTEMKERTEVGAGEDEIEQTQEELRGTRQRNQEQLGNMRKLVGSSE